MSDRPNILRCLDCEHEAPLTPERYESLPLRCPECDGPWRVRCGSKLRNKDRVCRKFVKPGQRCKMLHGGKSLKGPESPTWKHGGRSRYVPPRWETLYERSMRDPLAQRSMQRQLALFEGLIDDALKRIDTGESGAAWSELKTRGDSIRRSLRDIKQAGQQGDARRAGRLAQGLLSEIEEELLPVIERGVGQEAARNELAELFRKRARLLRVQQQGEKTVSISHLAALQARFVSLVLKYLDDQRLIAQFVAELREESLPGWKEADKQIRRLPAIATPENSPESQDDPD